MWDSLLLMTVVLTVGLILLAYVGAEVAYRDREQHRRTIAKDRTT